ncbi:hypothetical protein ACFL27_18345 [candidate division CSSED10-310 bacterium]|uniref:Uncharacterized protein n=1 Tax=candidate division CSSED10-310 bacterium TaxID=2855610 RepID=A0ABV6Z119_UNCC1
MALVNFLKFSKTMGAIIADEEFWTPRFRRRLHIDNLHPLLDEQLSDAWNMEVAYGGVGYPSVHREVVNRTRKILQEKFGSEQEDESAPKLVKQVARIAFESMQAVMRRRIDQKMLFKFGFTTDDLNRGFYEMNGQKIEIKNKEIKKAAIKLASGEEKDSLLKPAMESRAAVFGYDATNGITGYYLDSENGILAYNYEGFEAIGSGKYASGIAFGNMFGAKTLAMRQAGLPPAEGILELIDSALMALYHFKEVGGNLNFALINGAENTHQKRYQEIFDNEARLTSEIVYAYKWDEIDRATALDLIDALILKEQSWEQVESDLFSRVNNEDRFVLLLRNYKKKEVDHILLTQGHDARQGN